MHPRTDLDARVNYLARQRRRGSLAVWLGTPILLIGSMWLIGRVGARALVLILPAALLIQYLQFRAYTQMCPRCGQPLTVTRWGVYRTLPASCPTCGLGITKP